MRRAEAARAENLHDGFVAASILLNKQEMNPGWVSLDTSALFNFVMSLHRNITGTVLQKVLARMGGVRMSKEDVIPTGIGWQAERILSFDDMV